jgi:ribosomal protein S6--L-glutamate ligase
MNCDLLLKKNKLEVAYHGEVITGFDAVIPRIGTSATFHGAAVIRQFECNKIYTTLSSQSLLIARDKLSCLQVLAAHGIAIPKSAISNSYFSMTQMADDVGGLPMVVKLLTGTHGDGVELARTKYQMSDLIQSSFRNKQKVMLQEFIKEADGADIRAFVVGDKVVGSMIRQARPGEFRSNLHQGATATACTLSPEENEIAIKASNIMGLQVAGVDMLRSAQGPLVLEVNASPGLEGIEKTTKQDIAGSIISFIEENNQ